MNINPTTAVKVENPELIKQLANDVVRMAAAEHPMLEKTYERLVTAGEKYPYYTQMILKNAEYDSFGKATEELKNFEITQKESWTRFKRTRSNLSALDKSETGKKLYETMQNLANKYVEAHPDDKNAAKKARKIIHKKIAILSGLTENSKNLLPCSTNKFVKKWAYRFLRVVANKH